MMVFSFFFFFNDTATTEIYTLSLHDALPIWRCGDARRRRVRPQDEHPAHEGQRVRARRQRHRAGLLRDHRQEGQERLLRSEEHTSELQSRQYLVCRLLLEKKKTNKKPNNLAA